MQRYSHYAVITPDNAVNFADGECDAIYVGTAGVLQVVRPDGTVVAFTTVGDSIVLPIRAIRINATSTGASNMVALYVRKEA